MATCLFTVADLDVDTKVEHTIQPSTWRACAVEGSHFIHFQRTVRRQSGPLLFWGLRGNDAGLGPCLTAGSRSASERLKFAGQDGWWQIDDKGRLVLSGNAVQYTAGGKPLSAIGPSLESAQAHHQKARDHTCSSSRAIAAAERSHFPERAMLHWRIEVAAMKAVLLTFDHQLKNEPERFTCSATLTPVRRFIREVVESNSDGTPMEPLADYSLGLQYDEDYLDLYEKLRNDAGVPSAPFRHTLIVSANPPTHTLDVVFWAFKTDPHAFRLTQEWQGDPFHIRDDQWHLAGSGCRMTGVPPPDVPARQI